MKKILVSAIFLASASAYAQPTPPQQCMRIAQAFQVAASIRDSNAPPEVALSQITVKGMNIAQDQGKRIVNLVYFDGNFADAGGDRLFNQVYENCLHPNGRYQPLK